MRLLVIRHGIAENRETFASTGQDDALRPLTKQGKIKMERAAAGLCRVAGAPAIVATSPLVRAAQTARIVAAACGGEPVTVDALLPDARPTAFLGWLRERGVDDDGLVAAVGHDPHLGILVTWLMTGVAEPRVALRKGGACLLDFAGRPRRAGATLQWALTSSMLRGLAG